MVDSDPYENSFSIKMNNKVEEFTILLHDGSSTVREGGTRYGKSFRTDQRKQAYAGEK